MVEEQGLAMHHASPQSAEYDSVLFPSPDGVGDASERLCQRFFEVFPSPCGVGVASKLRGECELYMAFPSPSGVGVASKAADRSGFSRKKGFRPRVG